MMQFFNILFVADDLKHLKEQSIEVSDGIDASSASISEEYDTVLNKLTNGTNLQANYNGKDGEQLAGVELLNEAEEVDGNSVVEGNDSDESKPAALQKAPVENISDYGDSSEVKKKTTYTQSESSTPASNINDIKKDIQDNALKNDIPSDYDVADKDGTKDDVNNEEYTKDCPKVCPARDVMVCGRCQHNIFRTFLSTCHLRMYSCKYPEEELELVKRLPCMLSAPVLAELPKAQGSVAEPNDHDKVLKFIHCRAKGKLGKGDSKCEFSET